MEPVCTPKRASERIGFLLLLMTALLFAFSPLSTISAGTSVKIALRIVSKLIIFGVPIGISAWMIRKDALPFSALSPIVAKRRKTVTAISSVGVIILIQMLYAAVFPSTLTQIGMGRDTSVIHIALLLLLHAILPAVLEEVFFRGVMLRTMTVYKTSLAILMSSASFALMHFSVGFFPIAFACGLILGLTYSSTGSLAVTIGVHVSCNAFWFGAELFGVYFPEHYLSFMRVCITVCVLLSSFGLPFLKEMLIAFFSDREENAAPSAQFWTLPMVLFFMIALAIQLIGQALG